METSVFHVHDNDGSILGDFPLSAGDDAGEAKWVAITPQMDLYADHAKFIERVASQLRKKYGR
eukprot:m.115773 g.115773  ORF g.115773 m.115773 type:complete len:63 (-) comp9486_c0_seq2:1368-1556(-)